MTGPGALYLLAMALVLAGVPGLLVPDPGAGAYGAYILSSGDTHTHTSYSYPGAANTAQLVDVAKSRGLTWVAITDHDNAPPDGECEAATGPTFLCVKGMELTITNAHATAVGLQRTIPYFTQNLGDLMHESSQQGALNFVAHPFSEQAGTDYRAFGVWENYTGMEIYHGWAGWNEQALTSDMDLLAVQKWQDLLNSGRRLVGVGSSDTHDANNSWDQGDLLNARGAVGYARNVAYLREYSTRGILEALEQGRTYASDGPLLEMTVAGAVMGEELQVGTGTLLPVDLSGVANVTSTVRLLVNGTVVYSQSVSAGPFALATAYVANGDANIRAEVRSFNGVLFPPRGETYVAFANPVYVDTPPFDEPPEPPVGLRAWIEGPDVVLSWGPSPSPDVSHYAIYRADAFGAFDFTYRHARMWKTAWRDEGAALDGQTHYYVVRAIDRMGHEDGNAALAVKMAFPVVPGPNLLGLPIPVENASVTSLLQTVAFTSVRRFDGRNATPWSSAYASRPGSLDSVPTGAGFWVDAPSAGTFAVAGTVPPSVSVPLKAGWNLVAYPGHTSRPIATALAGIPWSRAEVFNANDPPYRLRQAGSGYVLAPGAGLWIHVTADTTWVVPA
jgi:hypothetical protein